MTVAIFCMLFGTASALAGLLLTSLRVHKVASFFNFLAAAFAGVFVVSFLMGIYHVPV